MYSTPFPKRNTAMPIIEARELRKPDILAAIPRDKPGWYRWWAPAKATRQLLGEHFSALRPHLFRGKKGTPLQGLYCVYVDASADESIRTRLNWHVNQWHTINCLNHKMLSALRQNISCLIGIDQDDHLALNTFIDQLTVEYFPVDFWVHNRRANQCLRQMERRELTDHVIPLAIRNNRQPVLADFMRTLRKARKTARAHSLQIHKAAVIFREAVAKFCTGAKKNADRTDFQNLKKLIEGKKVLYIIPDCAKQQPGGSLMIAPEGQVPAGITDPDIRACLYRTRIEWRGLLPRDCMRVNPNGSEFTPINPKRARYLRAYDRYTGYPYNVEGVRTLLQQKQPQIMIMSDLYGLLSPHDYIQNYPMHKGDANPTSTWRDMLPEIIDDFVSSNKIDIIVGLSCYYGDICALRLYPNKPPVLGIYARPCPRPNRLLRLWEIHGGIEHALLYLAKGVPIPDGVEYAINQVRP